MPTYAKELAVMRQAATEAARVIERFARRGFKTQYKGAAGDHNNPVTDADVASERAIVKRLHRAFPTAGFLGEEGGSLPGASVGVKRRFIIDPLDGTAYFTRGIDGVSVLIALEENGEIVAGVIRRVWQGVELYAAKGQGAWRVTRDQPQPARLRVSSVSRLKDATVCANTPLAAWWGSSYAPYRRLTNACRMVLSLEANHEFDLLVQGKIDAMASPFPKIWDVAAQKIILEEAGGRFSNVDGRKRIEGSKRIGRVFSNGRVHDALLKVLNR